ncbi:TIGR04282 family arsenosugar biosynthesis glycosyltransferase [Flavobacterium sp.]|uniref:TIGR04282 family arsenosugar biosynthesis glycosyltransferase n=1 Tax=Flavobacterium sp. TaxID=239 RepID=UPI00262C0981|nr:TIGR04282 family arsenosugar biosynthesis glycosyltransferase [Flavobacterium sp.]
MQHKKAIILFTKNPELGKVKTRLAKTIGDEKALAIYIKLLQHTRDIVAPLAVDKFVFYSENSIQDDEWDNAIYSKKTQKGDDLGIRMKKAFEEVFHLNYDSVCIIGSDCYELNTTIIEEAFKELQTKDAVIGPTFDGGYYLLGMNTLKKELFEDKEWSTASIFSDTVADFEKLNLNYSSLVKLNDIDEEKDVPTHWI